MMLRSHLRTGFRMGLRSFCQQSPITSNNQVEVVLKDNHSDSEAILNKIFAHAAQKSEEQDVDWDMSMNIIKKTEEVLPEHRPTQEELDAIRATKPLSSLASLINESLTLQKLVDLGVNLHKWEVKGQIGLAVKLDFAADVAPIIKFLADVGIPHDLIGICLSSCPQIIEQNIDDLKARVSYLLSKKFKKGDIVEIICGAPHWLIVSVKGIDRRLGFLQKSFNLTGNQVRNLAVTEPKVVVLLKLAQHVIKKRFAIKEEMGFSEAELKQIVVSHPFIIRHRLPVIQEQFDLLHNEIGMPHELLVKFPSALTKSDLKTRGRHKFLVELGRAQYDPLLPNYVPPTMLTDPSDAEFCEKVAKSDVDTYYKFLKTI